MRVDVLEDETPNAHTSFIAQEVRSNKRITIADLTGLIIFLIKMRELIWIEIIFIYYFDRLSYIVIV